MIADHVLAWARLPGPARLLSEIRQRLEAGRCGPRATIVLDISPEQRHQIGQLLGVRWQVGDAPVSVQRLREELASHGADLEELLTVLGGPLRNLPAERRAHRASREDDREAGARLLQDLDGRVPLPVIHRCLVGAEHRLARAEEIARVVAALGGTERLPVLAARLYGDAHALDRARPLGRAVARFFSGGALESAEPREDEPPWVDPVQDANAWRAAWASRQIICDEVSTQVLVLNLPLTGAAPAVRLAALAGEPIWLTLRSMRGELAIGAGVSDVYVCENPSIVEAAADRYGPASRPLICTFGLPSLAAHRLLARLAGSVRLHVRADGDGAGRRIVTDLLRYPGAQPWRMPSDCERYEEELLDELLADLAL